MKEYILEFSTQIKDSVAIWNSQKLDTKMPEIKQVVFCGMGGSGIGSKIVSQWVEAEISVPILQVQNYIIPSFIDKNTLVIGSSYSGETEETLAALQSCKSKGAKIVCVSSGGKLSAFCNDNNYDVIVIPGGLPPRAALGYSIVQVLGILQGFSLITESVLSAFSNSAYFLEERLQEIMLLAESIVDTINNTQIVIYAEEPYESIALRGKQQLNENSKYLCRYHVIPEMNHNELLGWGSGDQNHSAIFLMTSDMHPRNRKRFELTVDLIGRKTDNIVFIEAIGENKIEESMYLIHVLDWVSYFLGSTRGEDTFEIGNINYLKAELAK